MRCAVINMDGRLYRYSSDRRVSGRPWVVQFMNAQKVWRDVRNVDCLDRIWREANEGTLTPLYFDEVCTKLRPTVVFDEDTGQPFNRFTVSLKDRTDDEITADVEEVLRQMPL